MIEIITLTHAYLDSGKIKRHEYIDHFWRTTVWFFLCMIYVVCMDLFTDKHDFYSLEMVAYMIAFRIGFYDFVLNLFRGLSIWYKSETTTSVIDQWYRRNNINQNAIRIIFAIIAILWNLI